MTTAELQVKQLEVDSNSVLYFLNFFNKVFLFDADWSLNDTTLHFTAPEMS